MRFVTSVLVGGDSLQWAMLQFRRVLDALKEEMGLTNAVSAKGPDTTSRGSAIALAQCLVADSQSWDSIED